MTVKRVYWDEETHGLRDTPTRHGWHVELVRATEHDAEVTRLRSELDAAKSALAHSFCDLREEVLRLTKELAEARRALDNLMAAAWPHFQGMREDSDEMKALSKAQQALSALSPSRDSVEKAK